MPGESLNILMYDIATYTRENVGKTANSEVRLDAASDDRLWQVRGWARMLWGVWCRVLGMSDKFVTGVQFIIQYSYWSALDLQ